MTRPSVAWLTATLTKGPITEEEGLSYIDLSRRDSEAEIGWNHSLGDILTQLIQAGLQIATFEEYPYSSYNCFPGMLEKAPDQWVIASFPVKVPHMYAIKAVK